MALARHPWLWNGGALEKLGLVDLKDAREVTSGGVAQRQETTYSGIELPRLLDSLGFDKLDRHAVRAASITVEARDAYKASFSWGELYNTSAGPNVLLILKVNGSPLPERAGAFSLRAFFRSAARAATCARRDNPSPDFQPTPVFRS
jgi:hypothetical protein